MQIELNDNEEWLVRIALSTYREFCQKQVAELTASDKPDAAPFVPVWTSTVDRIDAFVERLDREEVA